MADAIRIIVAADNLPGVGVPVSIRGRAPVVVESFGEVWHMPASEQNESDTDIMDLAGGPVCYAYCRPVTAHNAAERIAFMTALREEWDEDEIADLDLDAAFAAYRRRRLNNFE